jgi:hypothetical protein
MLTDPLPSVRGLAAQTLIEIGQDNPEALEALNYTALNDSDESVRTQLIQSIRNFYSPQSQTPMSDQPKVQMNFNAPVTGVAGSVEGNFIVNASEQNLAEAAAEIQQLLNQLATTYPSTYLYEFEQQIPTNTRLRDTLIAGGIELLKILCPAAGIPIEMGVKWLETAKRQQ